MAYPIKHDLSVGRRTSTGLAYNFPIWVTAKSYIVGDVVLQSNKLYVCITAHTSTTFLADIANWAVDSTSYSDDFVIADWVVASAGTQGSATAGIGAGFNAQSTERTQAFTAVATGDLNSLDINLSNSSVATQTARIQVYAGNSTTTLLGSTTVTVIGNTATVYTATFGTAIPLTSGSVYTVGVVRIGASVSTLTVNLTDTDNFPGFTTIIGEDFKMKITIQPTGTSGGTLSYPAATHGLGAGLKHVTVYNSAGDILLMSPNVNSATGDVTITTNSAVYNGKILISK